MQTVPGDDEESSEEPAPGVVTSASAIAAAKAAVGKGGKGANVKGSDNTDPPNAGAFGAWKSSAERVAEARRNVAPDYPSGGPKGDTGRKAAGGGGLGNYRFTDYRNTENMTGGLPDYRDPHGGYEQRTYTEDDGENKGKGVKGRGKRGRSSKGKGTQGTQWLPRGGKGRWG
eukprot:5049235-Alexandrium_andersonii.AAC.1